MSSFFFSFIYRLASIGPSPSSAKRDATNVSDENTAPPQKQLTAPSPSASLAAPEVPSSSDTSSSAAVEAPGAAGSGVEDSDAAVPVRKKGAMGPAEKKAARAAAAAKAKKITEAVKTYVEEMDSAVKCLADELGISEDRIRQLAGQASSMKNKKAVSNWNVLVYFKGQELNEGMFFCCGVS